MTFFLILDVTSFNWSSVFCYGNIGRSRNTSWYNFIYNANIICSAVSSFAITPSTISNSTCHKISTTNSSIINSTRKVKIVHDLKPHFITECFTEFKHQKSNFISYIQILQFLSIQYC